MRRFLLLAFLVLLLGCSKKGKIEVGDRAIPFSLPALGGGEIRFNPKDKRVKILYFWADWCPRCREDFVQLERFYQEWKRDPKGPELITVNVGQSIEHVRHFVKVLRVTFPVALDSDGKVARMYGVTGLPTYFIVDGNGVVRYIILGWAEEKVLREYLRRVSG